MNTISKRLEKIFTAVAFAEVGEFDTAREIMIEDKQATKTVNHQKTSHHHHGIIHTMPATESRT